MRALLSLFLAAAPAAGVVSSDAGVEWHVHVAVDVGVDGRATGCRVVESDAPEDLQTRTCAILQEKGKFKPKLDAAGRAVPAIYETTIRYRIPEGAPGASAPAAPVSRASPVPTPPAPAPISAPAVAVADLLRTPVQVGDWSGACRKARPGDDRYVECVVRFVRPNMTGTITRTYKGAEIAITTPACGRSEPMGRASVSRGELKPPFGKSMLGTSLAGAIMAAKQQCSAMVTHVELQGQMEDLIAATDNLRKPD